MDNGIIYKATNLINGKMYIGQTKNTLDFRIHAKCYLGHEYAAMVMHCRTRFHIAIRKYGIENFKWEIIENCNINALNEREQYWICQYNSIVNGYNMTIGGDTSTHCRRNYKLSESTKLKISKSNSIALQRKDVKERLSKSAIARTQKQKENGTFDIIRQKAKQTFKTSEYKKKHSEATKRAMADPTVREKMRIASKLRWAKLEERQKASNSAKTRKKQLKEVV